MKPHSLLICTALVLTLSACNDATAPAPAPAPAAAPTGAATPASEQTQAFYGDEAPVAVPAEPADDHGHAHDDADGHAHDEPHAQGDDAHADGHAHDHGDDGKPHDH